MSNRTVRAQLATAENIARYGTLIAPDGVAPAFDSPVFSFWNDLSTGEMEGTVSFGMVLTKPGGLTAPMLERHLETTETIVPMEEEIVLLLAEPCRNPAEGDWPDLDTLAALRFPPGSAVTLKKGTWHYVPLVPSGKPARTLIVFRQGTPGEDLEVRPLQEEKDITIEVEV